jgi:hypothetical protein
LRTKKRRRNDQRKTLDDDVQFPVAGAVLNGLSKSRAILAKKDQGNPRLLIKSGCKNPFRDPDPEKINARTTGDKTIASNPYCVIHSAFYGAPPAARSNSFGKSRTPAPASAPVLWPLGNPRRASCEPCLAIRPGDARETWRISETKTLGNIHLHNPRVVNHDLDGAEAKGLNMALDNLLPVAIKSGSKGLSEGHKCGR